MEGYKRDGKTGLFIPAKMAKQIGIGCPKCDDHFLQDPTVGQASNAAQSFIRKHMHCGPLDALETRDGKVVCTGPVALVHQKPS